MRRQGSLFWGIVLVIFAGLLFFHQSGWLAGSIFSYFWPLLIITFGIWLLVGALSRGQGTSEGQQTISIPLENAQSARIKLDHGAGRLKVQSGASETEILSGKFGVNVSYRSRLEGNELAVKLNNSPHFWSWYPGQSLDWDVSLNNNVPISLKVDSGASSTTLDLSDLKVVDLDIDTGASSTEITLPANAGNVHVDIDAGASSLNIHVPVGVAARIRVKSGLASINIDPARFPRLDGGLYQSEDYPTATDRADITIDAGVGSIEIK